MVNFYFYKGRHKVKVLTKSAGYWIVEAQEDFEDQLNGEKVEVRAGEQRIVPLSELYKNSKSPAIPK
ncbi:MAG: hypothetical protein LBH79_09745 [Nitrososphaerota archaeon]|jgi:hypothetical protein|nr:hypothetical protein [Nitrososphaerota archaeon]